MLAVWILAAKLPNSDLNFAVDFGVDFPFSSKENDPKKFDQKSAKLTHRFVRINPPRSSDFCRSLFLIVLFVRNFWRVCSQFGWVFAILFEGLWMAIQEEIHHFASLGGGGLRGAKTVNKNCCEQTGVSYPYRCVCVLVPSLQVWHPRQQDFIKLWRDRLSTLSPIRSCEVSRALNWKASQPTSVHTGKASRI